MRSSHSKAPVYFVHCPELFFFVYLSLLDATYVSPSSHNHLFAPVFGYTWMDGVVLNLDARYECCTLSALSIVFSSTCFCATHATVYVKFCDASKRGLIPLLPELNFLLLQIGKAQYCF